MGRPPTTRRMAWCGRWRRRWRRRCPFRKQPRNIKKPQKKPCSNIFSRNNWVEKANEEAEKNPEEPTEGLPETKNMIFYIFILWLYIDYFYAHDDIKFGQRFDPILSNIIFDPHTAVPWRFSAPHFFWFSIPRTHLFSPYTPRSASSPYRIHNSPNRIGQLLPDFFYPLISSSRPPSDFM